MPGVIPAPLYIDEWSEMNEDWLNDINWNADGLVPAIAQDADDGKVLMVAWMNREAFGRQCRTAGR